MALGQNKFIIPKLDRQKIAVPTVFLWFGSCVNFLSKDLQKVRFFWQATSERDHKRSDMSIITIKRSFTSNTSTRQSYLKRSKKKIVLSVYLICYAFSCVSNSNRLYVLNEIWNMIVQLVILIVHFMYYNCFLRAKSLNKSLKTNSGFSDFYSAR